MLDRDLIVVWYRWFLPFKARVELRNGGVYIDGSFHSVSKMRPLIYRPFDLRPFVVERR